MDTQRTPTALDSLQDEEFINLTTYRKNGEPVHTPVWFTIEEERMYVHTFQGAGKVKRIRATGKVTFAPSDARGATHGSPIEGTARVIAGVEAEHAEEILQAKYGERRTAFMQRMSAPGVAREYLEIRTEA